MSLRKRTFLLTSVILLGLIVALYAASQVIVLRSFEEEEKRNATLDVQRIKLTINAELNDVRGVAVDWANWDELYRFMIDGNQQFRDSDLVDTTFPDNQLNLFLLVNNYGSLVYGTAYDLALNKEEPVPSSLLSQLRSDKLLNHPDGTGVISGVLSLPEHPLLIVSVPIMDSQGQGPSHGTLIFGRYLDKAEIQRLSNTTLYSLSIYQVSDAQMPADFRAALDALPDEEAIQVNPLSDQDMGGYTLFKDVYGKPALILRVDMPRTLYTHGQETVLYFMVALVLVGLVFGLASMFILERGVLSRVARLSSSANRVAARGDPSLRISDAGRDELSSLATSMNRMLEAMEQSRQKLVESERSYRQLMEQASDGIMVAYPGEKFLEVNSTICRMLGYTAEEMKERSISDVVAENDLPKMLKLREEVAVGTPPLVEVEMVRKEGTTVATEISASRLSDGRTQGIVRDITERKEYEQKLHENAASQAVLLRQLMNAQEAERRRLSMDIHDGPLQMLGVSLMALDRAARRSARGETDLTRQELDYLRNTLTETVDEVRAVLADLSQDALTTYGLVVAIQSHISRFIDVTGIEVEFKDYLRRRLLVDIELLLYRLLQESLANVRKHAHANKVVITLEEMGGSIILRISDDGVGFVIEEAFKRHEAGQGIGLRSMRERVYGAGGSLWIESSPGSGTTLEFTVPLPPRTVPLTSGLLESHSAMPL